MDVAIRCERTNSPDLKSDLPEVILFNTSMSDNSEEVNRGLESR